MPPRSKALKPAKASETPRFLQYLHHLGWSLASVPAPLPIGGGRSVAERARWQPLALPDGAILLLVHWPEPVPSLTAAFQAYEDLAPGHRALQAALAAAAITGRYLILLDERDGAQLIDLVQEDVLIDARGAEEIGERLLPLLHLNALARGSLTSFPRKAHGARASELRDWVKVWSARIGSTIDARRDSMGALFEWLLLARLAEEFGFVAPRKVTFRGFCLAAKTKADRWLTGCLRPLFKETNLLQGASLELVEALIARAMESGQLEVCLRSFSCLSRGKFSSELFAEAFADEALRAIGWRHALIAAGEREGQPDEPEDWLEATAEVALDEVGLPGLLQRFDRITADLRLLAREQAVAGERGERPGLQLDLLGADPPAMAEDEAPRVALQHVIRVSTASRERAAVARLVMLAHTAQWLARLRRFEAVFPAPRIDVAEWSASPIARVEAP